MNHDLILHPTKSTPVSVTACPVGIAMGATIDPITREWVMSERRKFFANARGTAPRIDRPKTLVERHGYGPGEAPATLRDTTKSPKAILAKIKEASVRWYPKTQKQRRWDMIYHDWSDQNIMDTITIYGWTEFGQALKGMDKIIDAMGKGADLRPMKG